MAASKKKPIRVKIVVKDIDRGYRDMMARINQGLAQNVAILVGITSGAGAEPHPSVPALTVLDIGTIHEFGLGVPQRSFIRAWFDKFQPTAKKQIAALMKAVVAGKYQKAQALELLGVRFVGECQRNMVTAPFQPLSPITIARKGSSKPLIDTGQLRSSITFRIEADGKQSPDRTETVKVPPKPESLKKRLLKAARKLSKAAGVAGKATARGAKAASKAAKRGAKVWTRNAKANVKTLTRAGKKAGKTWVRNAKSNVKTLQRGARKGVRMGKKAGRGFRKFFRAGRRRR